MSNIIKHTPGELTSEQIGTLAQAGVIPANTPPAIVKVFAETCRQHNLSPFKKEIYLVNYGSQFHTVVGIDGARMKAARTGQYAGCDDVKYDLMPDGSYKTSAQLKAENKHWPTTATATVYRMIGGQRCPFTHTAVFAEFYPSVLTGKGGFSKASSMPFQMIAKVAEMFALKKGFADEFSGLHIEEEAEVFKDNPAVTMTDTRWTEKLADEWQAVADSCDTIDELNARFKEGTALRTVVQFQNIYRKRAGQLTGK